MATTPLKSSPIKESVNMEIKLTDSQTNEFRKALKAAIYKVLYEKEFLTSSQLTSLLNRI